MVDHPSGIEDEAELANVSAEFWKVAEVPAIDPHVWDRLLSFQQGYKYCKDVYKIND